MTASQPSPLCGSAVTEIPGLPRQLGDNTKLMRRIAPSVSALDVIQSSRISIAGLRFQQRRVVSIAKSRGIIPPPDLGRPSSPLREWPRYDHYNVADRLCDSALQGVFPLGPLRFDTRASLAIAFLAGR